MSKSFRERFNEWYEAANYRRNNLGVYASVVNLGVLEFTSHFGFAPSQQPFRLFYTMAPLPVLACLYATARNYSFLRGYEAGVIAAVAIDLGLKASHSSLSYDLLSSGAMLFGGVALASTIVTTVLRRSDVDDKGEMLHKLSPTAIIAGAALGIYTAGVLLGLDKVFGVDETLNRVREEYGYHIDGNFQIY